MALIKQTSNGIDIKRILDSLDAEMAMGNVLNISYDIEGKMVRDHGWPTIECKIRKIRTGEVLCITLGISNQEAVDKAINELVEKYGVAPVLISEEARLKLEVETLKKQMADLMVAMAMPAPAPTRRKKVDFDVTNSAE